MVVEHLREELKRRTERNPRYSIRAFARALNIHPSTLAAILSEKRPLTPKTAERLLSNMGTDPVERQRMVSSLLGDSGTTRDLSSVESESQTFLMNWYHEAILSLMRSTRPPTTIAAISRRLELSPQQVNEALNRMIFLELIVPATIGWSLTGKTIEKSSEQSRDDRYHLQLLDKAKNSLKEESPDRRAFSGITFVGSAAQVKQVQDLIQRFCADLSNRFERNGSEDVYHLSVQVFPLTHAETSQS